MSKQAVVALVLVVTLLCGGVAAFAAPDDPITRGEFAAMLAEKAGIPVEDVTILPVGVPGDASYAGALATLVKAGIIVGYPDGTVGHDEPVTGVQAAVMVGRVLGLPSTLAVHGVEMTKLPDSHWAYGQVAWMSEYGLTMEGSMTATLSQRAAESFLDRVFSADQQAMDIVLKSMEAQQDMTAFSLTGTMQMNMIPKPGLDAEEAAAIEGMAGTTTAMQMEYVKPGKIRQVINTEVPGVGIMEMEQYIIGSKMYQKITNPETEEILWHVMTLPVDLASLEETQNPGIQAAMLEKFHYQYLGTSNLNGKKVYKIGYYGRIDDMGEFAGLMSQSGGSDAMAEVLSNIGDFIETMSFWGISYIGVDDYLTYGEKTGALIGYGNAVPIATMEMSMEIDAYVYDDSIVIQLPDEAKDAVVIEMPPMGSIEVEAAK